MQRKSSMLAIAGIALLVPLMIAGESRLRVWDIVEFSQDPPANQQRYFADFEVTRAGLEKIISSYSEVSKEHWRNGYHHIAREDSTGTIKLKDGSIIQWMVRPGGLAALTFQDGRRLYLARD